MAYKSRRYQRTNGIGRITFDGVYSHFWDPEIDFTVVSVVEAALEDVQKIVGGDLPSDLQGLLGCWSWVRAKDSQLCLLMEHAQEPNGYFVAHELAHLLHYSKMPDLFDDKSDLRENNLKEMIAHAGGLLFAPAAAKIKGSVERLSSLYQRNNYHHESLLEAYEFPAEEEQISERDHLGGYQAAEFILSKGIPIRDFVEMDALEAEEELEKLGYSKGLLIEPAELLEPEECEEIYY